MPLKASVPFHYAVLPVPVFSSLYIKDDLHEQRQLADAILFRAYDIYDEYFTTGHHELITPDMAEWTLRRTDHTSLRTDDSEDESWMARMAWEAANPVPMRSVCARLDKLGLTEIDKKTVVTGYPHGAKTPEAAADEIHRAARQKNITDIDSVLAYNAWMDGDFKKVEAILRAEAKAAHAHGLTWKVIQKLGVHAYAGKNQAYGADYFRSAYDSTMLSLECGADCAKTSTGVGAKAPFEHFDKKDTGPLARALPMLLALRDFNKKHNTTRWPKFSGGNESEADAAVLIMASKEILGFEVLDKIAFGTSYRFRKRLLEFIVEQEGPDCRFDPQILQEHQPIITELPPHRRGIPTRTPE